MEYRGFGRTDMTVSALGFGCWELGGTYGDIDEGQAIAAVHRAIDLGINCFDTAPAYGTGASERLLAKALGPRRKEVLVVTKCGVGYPERDKGRDSRRDTIMVSIEQSLTHLQTNYVDVLLIHWPDVNTPFEETMQTLDTIVQQGKARYVGVSNFSLDQLKACVATRRLDVVQYGLNLFDRRMKQEILPYCQDQGIGVMIYGPLAFGLLAGVFQEDTEFGANDWRADGNRRPELFLRLFAQENFHRNIRVVEELKLIAEKHHKQIPQLALRWVLQHPAVSVALVGSRSVQEVEDHMGALAWALSYRDREEIEAVFAKHDIDTSLDIWIDQP